MRLTQLRPDDDLRFGIDYEFFEEEERTSFVSSINFDWHTKPGHKSGVFLHVGEDFSDCIENNPEMLTIPSFADIDMNTDYTVELERGKVRGSFKDGCEKADDGSDTWRSWKRGMDKIRKMSVKLTDSKFLGPEFTLNDFFTMEYRLVHGKYLILLMMVLIALDTRMRSKKTLMSEWKPSQPNTNLSYISRSMNCWL